MFGEVREHFAIQRNLCFFKRSDELAVAYAVCSGGNGHLHLPERAEIAFAFFASMEGMVPRVHKRFLRRFFL